MKATNVLFLMCDEMSRRSLSCYGNSEIKTPNIDKLVESGTCFTNAYTPSPICVSARASLATGKHVHQIGNWSSAEPYDGSEPSWGHYLQTLGHTVTSIGKLHYQSTTNNNGFGEEILPMHVYQGVGWPIGLLRDKTYAYDGAIEMSQGVGAGETHYTQYDAKIADQTCAWLRNASTQCSAKPWVLFSSFVARITL